MVYRLVKYALYVSVLLEIQHGSDALDVDDPIHVCGRHELRAHKQTRACGLCRTACTKSASCREEGCDISVELAGVML